MNPPTEIIRASDAFLTVVKTHVTPRNHDETADAIADSHELIRQRIDALLWYEPHDDWIEEATRLDEIAAELREFIGQPLRKAG